MINFKTAIKIYGVIILIWFPYLVSGQEFITEKYLHLQGKNWKQIQDIALGKNGNIIVSGDFEDAFSFEGQTISFAGKRGHFITCLDSIGNLKWLKIFGSSNYSSITGIEIGKDEMIYIVGSFRDSLRFDDHVLTREGKKHVFYTKLNTSGEFSESKILLSDFKGHLKSFDLDSANNFILAGDFRRDIKIGDKLFSSEGKSDVFFLKVNAEGSIDESFTFGGKGSDELKGVSQTKNGLLLFGNFEKEIELLDTSLISAGKKDIFVVKRYTSDHFSKAIAIGGRYNDVVQSVVTDSMQNMYISGYFKNSLPLGENTLVSNGENDIFLANYNSQWEVISINKWGGSGNDKPLDLIISDKQELFISGVYNKSIQIGNDTLLSDNRFNNGFLAMISNNNGVKWVKDFKGDSEESPQKLFANGDSRLLMAGSFLKDLKFDNNSLESESVADAFLINFLDPCTLLKFNLPTNKTICMGAIDTLYAGDGFVYYDWNNGLSESEFLIISDPGKYWVEITDEYGCEARDTIQVKMDSLYLNFEVIDEKLPEGNNGRIDLKFGGGFPPYTILWDNFEQTESLENLQEGIYQVNISDDKGCEINQEIEVGRTVASGILDIYNFPNPMEDLTHIVYSLPENTSLEISLFDMNGKLVFVLYRGQNRKGKHEFDWSSGNLKNGVYYLRIQTPNGIVSKKILINRNN